MALCIWPGPDLQDLSVQNLGNSYVSSQTRRFIPIGVAPSVHGLPHIPYDRYGFVSLEDWIRVEARQAASNLQPQLLGAPSSSDDTQGERCTTRCKFGAQDDATRACGSQHQHPQHIAPARRFPAPPIAHACRQRLSTYSLLTLLPPGRPESHVAHADCMVLESRAACVQILQ